MQTEFKLDRIEKAFFNYDSDGSEQLEKTWKKRKEEWSAFKLFLIDDRNFSEQEVFIDQSGNIDI